jgi:PAS domain S-box-containing protein
MHTEGSEMHASIPDRSRPDLDLMHAVIEQAPDAIIMIDNAGAVQIWNRRAVEIFGFSMEEAREGGLDLIIPENLKAAHDRGFGAAIAAGKTRSQGRAILTRAKHRNGTKLYVEMSFAIVTDASGRISGALAIARDVTERRLAELARRKNPE